MRTLALILLVVAAPVAAQDGVRRVNVRKLAIIPTVMGAASLLGGVGALGWGYAKNEPGFQNAGWTAFGVGIGLIVIGALTCALGGASSSKVSASVMLSPNGAGIAASGVF